MTDGRGTDNDRPKAKRPRVAVACQRCKTRKQKCDGNHPSCANCLSYAVECVYVPLEKRQANRDQYVRGLEQKVQELETALAKIDAMNVQTNATNSWEILDQNCQTQDVAPMPLGLEHNDQASASSAPTITYKRPSTATNHTSDHQDYATSEKATTVTDILRDLSMEASGRYIGASSNLTMGRIIGSLVKRKDSVTFELRSEMDEETSPRSLYQPTGSSQSGSEDHTKLMQNPVCDKLILAYLKNMSLRWPLIRTSFIIGLHKRRETLTDPYEIVVIHLVYAIGGRFLETTGQIGAFSSEDHHAAAQQHLDEVLEYNDVRTIEVLLLLSLHSLRAPKGPGAWSYVGLAMRLCIDLGLHRRNNARGLRRVQEPSLSSQEMRKRVFWTAYCLDRQVSIILGRPFSISDRDIDAELPLDINEDVEDDSVIAMHISASDIQTRLGPMLQKPSSMSCFIHLCRLRVIESNIQQSIYRVDDPSAISEAEVEHYLRQLEQWRASMPRHDMCSVKPHGFDLDVNIDDYDTEVRPHLCCQRLHNNICESQMVYYYKCLRFLLHPHLLSSSTNPRFLSKCAEACGGVCQTYKRLHQRVSVGFSLMALHSVFLAGLTLIYCTWLSPKTLLEMRTTNDMNACLIVLYIITERWPAAKRYREIFENVKQTVLDSIEENGYEERIAISALKPSLEATMGPWQQGQQGPLDFEAMMADMAGDEWQKNEFESADMEGGASDSFNFASAMGGLPMPFPDIQLGLGMGLSPDTISNQWMFSLDADRAQNIRTDLI